MVASPIVWLAIAGLMSMVPVTAAEFTPIDPAHVDVGCSYSLEQNASPFLVVLALPPVADGPRVFLGVDGADLEFEIKHDGEPTSSYRRKDLQLAVHYGEPIEQDCGDDCAGSMRKVRVELDGGIQRVAVEAIEHCGC